ncbi:MAG: tRNA-intron lyase [Candidatus Hodarchaeota archaeon]
MAKEPLLEKLEHIRRDLDPPYEGKLIGDQVLIFDKEQGSSLYAKGFYGKPIGIKKPDPNLAFNRELQLNLLEAIYLMENEWLTVTESKTGEPRTKEDLIKIAIANHEKFEEKFLVYKDLRKKGYIVRPGLKFGADFTVYKHGPGIDHSSFVVQVLEHKNKISAIDMVRAGRLATSVKKRFVIASISSGDSTLPQIAYYVFKWFKP